MIESRNDIKYLFTPYLRTQHEWLQQVWTFEKQTWSGERQNIYSNGIVLGKFREKDQLTVETLKIGVTDETLKHEIILSFEHDIRELEQKILKQREAEQVEFYNFLEQFKVKKRIDEKKEQLRDLQWLSIDQWIEKHCRWIKEETQEITKSEEKVLLYLYYVFENISYERNHPYCRDLDLSLIHI